MRRGKRKDPSSGLTLTRQLANQAFSRASGAPLRAAALLYRGFVLDGARRPRGKVGRTE